MTFQSSVQKKMILKCDEVRLSTVPGALRLPPSAQGERFQLFLLMSEINFLPLQECQEFSE